MPAMVHQINFKWPYCMYQFHLTFAIVGLASSSSHIKQILLMHLYKWFLLFDDAFVKLFAYTALDANPNACPANTYGSPIIPAVILVWMGVHHHRQNVNGVLFWIVFHVPTVMMDALEMYFLWNVDEHAFIMMT
eukprot:scaffold70268_cov71-Attheya_sp.AAC.2